MSPRRLFSRRKFGLLPAGTILWSSIGSTILRTVCDTFSFNSFLASDIWFSGVWSLLLGVHCLRKCGSSFWVRTVGEMGFKIVYGVNSILFTVVLPSDYMRHIYQTFIIILARNTLHGCYLYGFTPCLAHSSLHYDSFRWLHFSLPASSHPKYRAKF